MIWTILGIISIALLIIYWGSRNAVWGGFTIGFLIGFIVAIFLYFQGTGFDWHIIGKGAIVGTMLGLATELLGRVSELIKK